MNSLTCHHRSRSTRVRFLFCAHRNMSVGVIHRCRVGMPALRIKRRLSLGARRAPSRKHDWPRSVNRSASHEVKQNADGHIDLGRIHGKCSVSSVENRSTLCQLRVFLPPLSARFLYTPGQLRWAKTVLAESCFRRAGHVLQG
jgi:hypothetical protein